MATSPVCTVHMIGNAHIDPVWLWPVEEGRAEVLASYRTAIDLIARYEGYIFTSGGAITYTWVEQDDPALLADIQAAVRAGRWGLVNGWWLQPDCNIPAGESFARHALYGQATLQRLFGQRARVGYNVDSFGHSGTLPQLLQLGGLDTYVFFRPDPGEKALPAGPFWWQSPDGSRVLTSRPPLHYGSPENADMPARIAAAARDALAAGQAIVMCFYGVGNHGGGPTRRNVEAILEVARAGGPARPLFSTPERYFQAVRPLGADLPTIQDELQHHSRGCYSALSRIKRENRLAEHALLVAERWDALAGAWAGANGHQSALAQAWQSVLLGQFHDILAGTCIRDGYEAVWQGFAQAQATAEQVRAQALFQLAGRLEIPAQAGAQPVVVWNPSAWSRHEPVRLRLPLGGWRYDGVGNRYPSGVEVLDGTGQALPAQITDVVFDHNTYIAEVDTLVAAPALGATVLQARLIEGEPPAQAAPSPVASEIANDYWDLRLDAAAGIASLLDRRSGRELLTRTIARPLVIDDPSDTWSHDVAAFRDVLGAFQAAEAPVRTQAGPVQQTLHQRLLWGQSTLDCWVTLYRNQPWIDLHYTVDWREQNKMLKLAFPFGLAEPRVTSSAPYGWIARAANGEEEPTQAWLDLSGRDAQEPRGFTLLNDCKYGYDALDGELRLTILRSPIYAFHRPRQMMPGVRYHYTDQGEQTWHCRLLPHSGDWHTVQPARTAAAFQEPLEARLASAHRGDWQGASLLRVAQGSCALAVVKRAEQDGALVVRGHETDGQPTQLVLVSDAWGRRWEHAVRPHEIWTLELPLDGGQPRALNLLEEPLARE